MEIRKIDSQDAEAYLDLLKQLDRETQFMLFEPGERKTTAQEIANRLIQIRNAENEEILVAEDEGKIMGYIEGHGGSLKRNRGCVDVVIGVLHEYTRRGIGTKLFEALEKWALEHEAHRLELTVMEHNRAAMLLYDKCGFHVEGMRKRALLVDGRFVNEFYMAKFLEGSGKSSVLME